jgi:hypothetical protein
MDKLNSNKASEMNIRIVGDSLDEIEDEIMQIKRQARDKMRSD